MVCFSWSSLVYVCDSKYVDSIIRLITLILKNHKNKWKSFHMNGKSDAQKSKDLKN